MPQERGNTVTSDGSAHGNTSSAIGAPPFPARMGRLSSSLMLRISGIDVSSRLTPGLCDSARACPMIVRL
jgi:hypothetical protein